jgi:hypothetical protein|tara:strand:- start:909 stop:1223 length:315 start_codon:yes stop_codon:yes gene_type:complete
VAVLVIFARALFTSTVLRFEVLFNGAGAAERLAASAADVLVLIVLARDRFAVHRFEVLLSGVRAPEHLAASAALRSVACMLRSSFDAAKRLATRAGAREAYVCH